MKKRVGREDEGGARIGGGGDEVAEMERRPMSVNLLRMYGMFNCKRTIGNLVLQMVAVVGKSSHNNNNAYLTVMNEYFIDI